MCSVAQGTRLDRHVLDRRLPGSGKGAALSTLREYLYICAIQAVVDKKRQRQTRTFNTVADGNRHEVLVGNESSRLLSPYVLDS